MGVLCVWGGNGKEMERRWIREELLGEGSYIMRMGHVSQKNAI
jgi:hypothetical protein